MEIAIEVFEQGQKRSFVRRYPAGTIRVGRAWDNDIVIRDPLVDAHQLELSLAPDGQWQVADLNSTNGTRIGREPVQGTTGLGFGQVLHFGHSQLKLHRLDQAVEPTLQMGRLDRIALLLQHPALALGLTALAIWLGLFTNLIGAPADASWSENASQALTLGSGLFAWAIAWGSIARMLRHEMAFWSHLSLISLLLAVSLLGYLAIDWVAFNSLSVALTEALSGVIVASLVFVALLVGLAITTRIGFRSTLNTSVAVSFVALSLVYLLPALEDEPDQDGPEMITIAMRPSLLTAGSISNETFLQRADALFAQLDEERADSVDEIVVE